MIELLNKSYKIKNLKLMTLAALCFIFLMSGFVICFYQGSSTIINYIKNNVMTVQNRGLEYGLGEDGYYFIKNSNEGSDIKVLQLTDLHLTASFFTHGADKKLTDTVFNLVKSVKPDLIVLTGDIIYSTFYIADNKTQIKAIGLLFDAMQIPWAVTYGNHDETIYGNLNKSDLSQIYESFKYCLFQRGPNDIEGQGNYVIKLLGSDGELTSALFMMDTNSYVAPFTYDHIYESQVAWYEREVQKLTNKQGEIVPTHLFSHIPLYQYKQAWELYQEGSPEVSYHFGNKVGKRISALQDKGLIFEKLKQYGTKTVFAGHDHTHDFSITYQGVRLTYGLTMDNVAYPFIVFKDEYKGGTLLEINTDTGGFEILQVRKTNGYLPN